MRTFDSSNRITYAQKKLLVLGEICLIYKRSYREINKIQAFIKDNYQAMYDKWQEYSKTSFYIGK